ncbi:N-terminal Xaa-Pro-Lys N-methyltransferase 1-like isoform X2 [Anneissia japonica]|uniref:N-terminal Xaa-Pro-Lys N-methyltransferase 1-like isoform X1 n=1 Tax=Anneissia japonica TaxID=1529436 RepID=UPI0014258624|nr:N-terminal Xaa-Pro-Lys N-methyltransferase 1-like isoform X1 [Anneissia japonica]XP_033122040.1 N-terminal Xaa-Pro-Lys N-methyltransferase 1-like isoform X2 [Anneissia japonica]
MADDARDAMTKKAFYSDAKNYWEKVPATVDGMLGGYGSISSTDIVGSQQFLKSFMHAPWAERIQNRKALDCGAGIGRVSKHLLLPLFQSVDLLEQEKAFLDEAKTYLADKAERIGDYINKGLQDFMPPPKMYDLIWCQWVLGHLSDDHLVSFFKRCKEGLADSGLICIKENIAKKGVIFDDQDSSVTRSYKEYLKVFNAAGLKVVKEHTQTNFPLEIYTVKIIALR